MNNKIEIDFVRNCIPERKKDASKADHGKILIIAGSKGMLGAGILASRAALRTGSGLVYLSVPDQLQNFANIATPEIITFGDLSIQKINNMDIDVVAIGPGLGLIRKKYVVNLIKSKNRSSLVLDADALNSISENPGILGIRKYPTIITPHPGEMNRLTNIAIKDIQAHREKIAVEYAKKWNAVIVLKGYNTVIADPCGKFLINPTGNPGMATAGAGDVLTGIITALIGQGISPFDASICGVFIHGLAGDLCAKVRGQHGIIASDIIETIPYIFKSIRNTKYPPAGRHGASRDTV